MEEEILEKVIENFRMVIKKVNNLLSDIMGKIRKVYDEFKPFFDKYGYDINYLNKVVYMANHAKKKRVRNKYKNMIKRTLGEDKLNKLLED